MNMARTCGPRITVILAVVTLALGVGCKLVPTSDAPAGTAAAVPPSVSAHTSGTISKLSPVRVQFHTEVTGASAGAAIQDSPFALTPKVAGKARWVSATELLFEPAQPLASGARYNVEVNLESLGLGKEPLRFDFDVMPQSFDVTVGGLGTPNIQKSDVQELRGQILTADAAEAAAVEKMLQANLGGKRLEARWVHSDQDRRHAFVVQDVVRQMDTGELTLTVDGAPLGLDRKVERTVSVPSLNTFSLVSVQAAPRGGNFIEVRFSDPIAPKQNLDGLITVEGREDVRLEVEGNLVRIYRPGPWGNTEQVRVSQGIVSTRKLKLGKDHTFQVSFADQLPAVRFASQGVVVPTTQGLTVPFEATNLRAVLVEATRVPFDNVSQFLQVNNLDGDRELRRVGRTVWRQIVELPPSANARNRWIRHGLDMGPLLANNPPGLYRIKMSFGPQHIDYTCSALPDLPLPDLTQLSEDSGDEGSLWDFWGLGQSDYSYWDLYENRTNPCHAGFYRTYSDHTTVVTRNVLLSDIGLIAKRGAAGSMVVVATDLRTAKPLEGAALQVLDYQQQPLAEGVTAADGTLVLKVSRRPYVVLARHGGQLGALRLEVGEALSVAHFDTGGAANPQGLKGFFYGERGVWRPGDDIYLTFILQDESQTLPANHPVHFELRNSRNQVVDRITRTSGLNGFYAFKTQTDPDAPTGNYVAEVKVGGASFTKTLKIETVRPNRLKIDFDFGTDLLEGPVATLNSALRSQWLHGAPAKNLKVDVAVAMSPTTTRFPKYDEFVFDDPTRRLHPESEQIFAGTLDATGESLVNATLQAGSNAPGLLNATFTTRVYEPSGAFSVDRHTVRFSPYERYVGIRTPPGDKARGMLLTDTKHPVRLVAVDAKGEPSATKVEVKLYKVNWRWWWEKGEDTSLADFVTSQGYQALQSGTVELKDGIGEWPLEIKYPNWGRYLLVAKDLNGNHRSGKIIYVDWPGWAGRQQKDMPGGASVLSFTADKQTYKVGEEVTLSIPMGKEGRALVSLETGSRVLQTAWVEPQGEMTRYTFTATANMAPSVYAHVTYLQPHLSTDNDHPIRMYGVVPVSVLDPASKLQPVVEAPEVFEPEASTTIRIGEAKGKPMTYTVAVVDEGLLGLTRYQTPNPWEHFFAREALGVKTWDLFDDVAGAYGGTLETLLAIGGGDEGEGEDKGRKANRFPPVVRYYGPFHLEAGAKKDLRVDMPQYVGAVRVMVVAAGNGAYGATDKSVFVRKPLLLLGSLPRVLGPGEELELPVAVFALDEKVRQVEVSAAAEGPVSVEGAKVAKLSFDGPGDQMVSFKLQVKAQLGVGTIRLSATGGGEKAAQTIELDVRHPGEREVNVLASTLAAGESWKQNVSFSGMAGTNAATLEISRVPPLNLEQRLSYLIGYPHGCVEQITSKAFPQVYLSALLDLDANRKAAVDTNVRAAITKMHTYQQAGGGFSYWPGGPAANDWSTTYVGHFLLEAKRAGHLVPASIMSSWVAYQQEAARKWQHQGERADLSQAYRLYTLALAGEPDLASMNRLKNRELSGPARWRLAAAYQLAGQTESAESLIAGQSVRVASYQELDNTFGSALRDEAMILETLVLLKKSDGTKPLVDSISHSLAGERGLSTQELAYALVAMARFAQEHPPSGVTKVSYRWGGKSQELETAKALASVPLAADTEKGGELEVRNSSGGTLFARVIVSGLPAVGTETGAENGLAVSVAYATPSGVAVDPARVEQGADLVAKVTVRNTGTRGIYKRLALSHLFPSGWEILNERLDPGLASAHSNRRFEYRDIRDDRVYTYFSLAQGASKTFVVRVNAAFQGRFYLPAVSVQTMYDDTINGRQPGRWVEVSKPGTSG